jgi:HlyD family secretion protein
MKKVIVVLVLLALAGGAYAAWHFSYGSHPGVAFRTVQVERGDLLTTINATGTIEPEEVIDVGAQVAGQILSFGPDPRGKGKLIDYGSPVEKGTVLAQIDDSLYKAQVDRQQAQLESAKAQLESANAQVVSAQANVQRSEADLEQMKAKLYQADRDWARAKKLGPGEVLAPVDYDTIEATYRTAKATLGVGEATVAQTKAAVLDAKANVSKAKAMLVDAQAALDNALINLHFCTIKSPVKGVIVDRRVNIGQTVVSSLNTPSLFLIAKDLKRLQVWASVNEADIASVHSGQAVTFTVDAYPGRVFKGKVAADQPRLNASMTQNVVTYTVVVETDNSDGVLKPYLTANLLFEVTKHTQTLLVPNTALRWKPNPQLVVPEARDEYQNNQRRNKGPGGDKPAATPERDTQHKGVLWVEDGGYVRPVKVRLGLSDGLMTEVVEGDIKESDTVVIGENRSGETGDTTNPFAPKMFGGAKKQ